MSYLILLEGLCPPTPQCISCEKPPPSLVHLNVKPEDIEHSPRALASAATTQAQITLALQTLGDFNLSGIETLADITRFVGECVQTSFCEWPL